jgi:hypothetical protein
MPGWPFLFPCTSANNFVMMFIFDWSASLLIRIHYYYSKASAATRQKPSLIASATLAS